MMTRLLTFSLLMLVSLQLSAQSLNAGFRGGIGYWCGSYQTFANHLRPLQGRHLAFVPELFARYNTKKDWALELAINSSVLNYTEMVSGGYYGPSDTATEVCQVRHYTGRFSVQYDVTAFGSRKAAWLQKFHSYAGVSLSPVMMQFSSSLYPGYSPNVAVHSNTTNALELWTGLSLTATYDIGKRLMLISVANFEVRPTKLLAHRRTNYYYHPVAKFGGQLGAAYRF